MINVIICPAANAQLYDVNRMSINSKNMKTLIIATDFSENAKHAAEYGYALASQFKADVVLGNAFIVPAEVPEAGLSTWPAIDYEELNEESRDELKMLKDLLLQNDHNFSFKPTISYVNDSGTVTDVLTALAENEGAGLTVMATHGNNSLSTFLLGNHSRKMIDATKGLLMLIPFTAPITPVKKIAFATDFKDPEKDLKIIYELIRLFRPLNAELLVTHITHGNWPNGKLRDSFERFLVDISNKADYPHIYYRIVRSDKPEKGLEWLCEHGQVDVLAMAHRQSSLLSEILNLSHTKKMAGIINIPLLVVPEDFIPNC
jgi:nucleotide-binding universal stress UspA family protein